MTWNSQRTPAERDATTHQWRRFSARFADDVPPPGGDFYDTARWAYLRKKTIARYGNQCLRCGVGWTCENPIQVDHIKPRSKYPELAHDPSNLQVLCKSCNHAKGNWDETDWRPK